VRSALSKGLALPDYVIYSVNQFSKCDPRCSWVDATDLTMHIAKKKKRGKDYLYYLLSAALLNWSLSPQTPFNNLRM